MLGGEILAETLGWVRQWVGREGGRGERRRRGVEGVEKEEHGGEKER
mgnify:CR=1 FL=1